jgi:molybdate transport system permease protein
VIRRARYPRGWLLPASLAIAFLVAPVVVLIGRAFLTGELWRAAGPTVGRALVLSGSTTVITLGLSLFLGTPLALLLARSRSRAAGLVQTLVELPIVLPPSVAGLALLLVFGSLGPVGGVAAGLGMPIPFTTAAVILAQTFVAAPFFISAARAGFDGVDHEVEDAARVDGAGEWSVFRNVTAPLARPALVAGAAICWARALGEFGATIMFAGNVTGRTQTLPLAVYAEFQSSLDASIAAAAILVIAAFVALVGIRSAGGLRVTS